ncbi:uncharacterized protein LOC133866962 [Alnus glutinosa]|uniref:uncharacterized protein LOC133866962 n=1 Tax=Alnus glutinosa TaxID=3517 RepID=UPI002D77C3D2|nr:uncharacterized protein LOC133866962 [Alnus glutinosa]
MSLTEVLRGEIQARVKRFIWENYVDPNHNLVENLPPSHAAPEGNDGRIYNAVLYHVLPYIFGNIAIIGTSGKDAWPNIAIPLPHFSMTGDEGQQINWDGELNLSVICPGLEEFRRRSNYVGLNSGTLRSLCEPFAGEARRFLHDRRAQGVVTNIYKKGPRAFELAPWVAFDFAGGLNMFTLTRNERTVIQRMNTSLSMTEGQKKVFRAQASR